MPSTRGPPRMFGNVAGQRGGRRSCSRGSAPRVTRVRIGIVTREWPPDVYGGAGGDIEHLLAAVRSLPGGEGGAGGEGIEIDGDRFGAPPPGATPHAGPAGPRAAHAA